MQKSGENASAVDENARAEDSNSTTEAKSSLEFSKAGQNVPILDLNNQLSISEAGQNLQTEWNRTKFIPNASNDVLTEAETNDDGWDWNDEAGTNEPICAINTINAACRKK